MNQTKQNDKRESIVILENYKSLSCRRNSPNILDVKFSLVWKLVRHLIQTVHGERRRYQIRSGQMISFRSCQPKMTARHVRIKLGVTGPAKARLGAMVMPADEKESLSMKGSHVAFNPITKRVAKKK